MRGKKNNINNGDKILTFRFRVKLSDHTFQTVVPQLALRAWADNYHSMLFTRN